MDRPLPTRIGSYQVLHLLGRGGMADVFAAEPPHQGPRVALKLLRPEVALRPQAVERFVREARILSRLDHPGIVRVLDCAPLEGSAFLVMELLHGITLREWMRRQGGPAPVGEARLLGRQVADAMAAVHAQGIVHRDLKPENVFLCAQDAAPASSHRIKLLDFGIAKPPPVEVDSRGTTQLHTDESALLGTYHYMAPEQLRSDRSLDEKADVYALGIVLFELLTGRHPFESDNVLDVITAHLERDPPRPQQLVSTLPGELGAFLLSMLAKTPEERPTMRRCADFLGHPWEDVQDTCPLPGLAPFSRTQAELFYGRTPDIQTLLSLLSEAATGRRRWIQLEGASGVGKSSLLQAGVLPRLPSASWLVVTLRPGARPLEALARALFSALPGNGSGPGEAALEQALRAEPGALQALVTARTPEGRCLLLVIEPLEELFTLGTDESSQLDVLLAQALAAPDCPLRLLTSVRSDFLHRLEELPALARHLRDAARYLLLPLEETALAQVIEGMAHRAGLRLAEGLAERMVRDARSEGGRLLLLGHALRGLWTMSRGAPLTHAHYDQLGGVGGALAQQAEALLGGLGAEGRERAKWLLLSLVRRGRDEPATRRPRSRREVLEAAGDDARAEEVLLRLSGMPARGDPEAPVGMRLVVLTGGAVPEQRVELVHDLLVLQVPSLARWLHQEQALLERDAELEVSARTWEQVGCPVEGLPTGTLLAHYRGGGRDSHVRRVSPLAERFLRASEREERRRVFQRRGVRVGALLAVLAILFYALRADQERRVAEQERRATERARQRTQETFTTYIRTVDGIVGGLDWQLSWLADTLSIRQDLLTSLRQALTALPLEDRALPEARRVEVELIQRQADMALHDKTLERSAQYLDESRRRLLTWGAAQGHEPGLMQLLALDYSKHGKVEQARGRVAHARADYLEAVRLLRRPEAQSDDLEDDRRTLAVSLQELAEAEVLLGRPIAALPLLEEAIALHEHNGKSYNDALRALALQQRGDVARRLGQRVKAREDYTLALQIARACDRERGDLYGKWVLARVLVGFADFRLEQGERVEAEKDYLEARDLGDTLREGEPPSKRFTLVWLDALAGLEALHTASMTQLRRTRCDVARGFRNEDVQDVRFQLPDCRSPIQDGK